MRNRPSTSEKPAAAQGNLNLNIVIPGRFFVEGHGLTSEWKADLLVSGTPEDPQITGQITAIKGTFDFLTKIFQALTRQHHLCRGCPE